MNLLSDLKYSNTLMQSKRLTTEDGTKVIYQGPSEEQRQQKEIFKKVILTRRTDHIANFKAELTIKTPAQIINTLRNADRFENPAYFEGLAPELTNEQRSEIRELALQAQIGLVNSIMENIYRVNPNAKFDSYYEDVKGYLLSQVDLALTSVDPEPYISQFETASKMFTDLAQFEKWMLDAEDTARKNIRTDSAIQGYAAAKARYNLLSEQASFILQGTEAANLVISRNSSLSEQLLKAKDFGDSKQIFDTNYAVQSRSKGILKWIRNYHSLISVVV